MLHLAPSSLGGQANAPLQAHVEPDGHAAGSPGPTVPSNGPNNLICAPGLNFGRRSDWYQNITAAGACRMRLGGEQLALGAPALVPADWAAKDLPRLFSFALRHGQGDLQASWTLRWPATSNRGPSSFDGIIDGGTSHFAAAHGSFHAATLPNGDMRITAVINADQR